jgi:hypothetical protein
MKIFSLAVLLAISVVFLSCSNAPVQTETGIMVKPPNTDITSDEVELFCKDMTYEESIDCVANLKDKKQEDWEKWQSEYKK